MARTAPRGAAVRLPRTVSSGSSEARFRQRADAWPVPVLVHRDAAPLYVNPRCAELFGYDRDELMKLASVAPLFARDDGNKVLNGAHAAEQVCQGRCKDGTVRRLTTRVDRITWMGRPATRIKVTGVEAGQARRKRDTAKVRATGRRPSAATPSAPTGPAPAALADGAALLRAIVRHAPMDITLKDTAGRYLMVSRQFERLFGLTDDAVRGKTAHDIFPRPVADAFRRGDREVLETAAAIERQDVVPLADGDHTFHSVKFPIRDRAGEVTAIAYIATDITERMRTEAALRTSERRRAKAVELAKIGFWRWSADSHELEADFSSEIEFWDTAPARRSDRSYDDFLRLVHPDDRADVARVYADADDKGADFELEYRVVKPDGGIRHVHEIGEAERDADGAFLGHVGTVQDVTELKQTEERLRTALRDALTANEIKNEFLANISHELRTPLNAVIGFAELMENQAIGPLGAVKYVEYARNIGDSGRNLLSLIDRILAFSTLEAGRLDVNDDEVDVGPLIRRCCDVAKHRQGAADARIRVVLAEGLPRIRADRQLMHRALVNLLTNAIKFTPTGGRIEVSAARLDDGRFCLKVADDGIGMDPTRLAAALSPFDQVEDPLSRRQPGVGIGLSTAKSLVELHGGRLEVESEPRQGTVVTVYLPARRIVP